VRILLLEDNADLADAITSRLKSKDFVVDIASNIQAAESALAMGSFDLALFDLSLPDGSSLALLQKIRSSNSAIYKLTNQATEYLSATLKLN
jgi:DNA-binding response OmpR family regulator